MKKVFALVLCLTMMLTLASCGPMEEEKKAGGIAITDMVGREITVHPGTYQRVVCIGAGALRMYSYVGDMNLLCGVEDIDNTSLAQRPAMFDTVARPYVMAYEELLQKLPSCGVGGPMAQAAEAEKILSCDPDIVISEFEDVDKSNALQEQLGVPVITLSTGKDGVFDQKFFDSMTLLGKIFGKEDRAQELVQFVKDEQAAIEATVAGIADADKPSVYICGLGNWGTTDHLMTAENFVSFRVAGVKNAVSGLGMEGVGPIEEEKFVSLGEEIDIAIVDAAAVKNIKPLLEQDPHLFDACKAWREGEIYLEMAYNAYYTNYEIALANTWFIAKTVYPERFKDIDMTEKLNQITKMFQGKELAEEIYNCPASYGGYQKIYQ